MRGRLGIFLGYPTGIKGYNIYDIEKRRMAVSRDVRFDETKFPFTETESEAVDVILSMKSCLMRFPVMKIIS